MVDINLFDEEGKEKEKAQKPAPEEGFDDDFDLSKDLEPGDDFSESSPLDDEEFLSDEEALSDFEKPEEKQEEEYEFGESKKKNTSPVLWVILGIVVIGAFIYLFIIQPRQMKTAKMATSVVVRRPPAGQVAQIPQKQGAAQPGPKLPATKTAKSSVNNATASRITTRPGKSSSWVNGSIPTFVEATKIILEDLSGHNQFGSTLLDGNSFFVEYVSETPGVSKAMGYRIQTLLGASGYKVSPEERHRTEGRIHYWGVVSGKLPKKNFGTRQTITKRFTTVNSFIREVKNRVRQNGLKVLETQKLSRSLVNGVWMTPVRVTTEGTKMQTLTFLESLKGFQGNYGIAKLLVAPLNYSDFSANNVKCVLDFLVSIG